MLSALKVVSVLLAASGSVLSVTFTPSQSPLSEALPGSVRSKCSGEEPQSCKAGVAEPDKCCYQSPGVCPLSFLPMIVPLIRRSQGILVFSQVCTERFWTVFRPQRSVPRLVLGIPKEGWASW